MANKITSRPFLKKAALSLAVIILSVSAIGGSFLLGYRQAQYASSNPPGSVTETQNKSGENPQSFGLFWQAWNIVNERFSGDRDSQKRVEGAIAGMLQSLDDPYTVYLPANQSKMFRDDLEGSFGGIGAELSVRDGRLTIVSSLEDTPAQRAGLKGQDWIVEIEGKKTAEMSLDDAIDAIRGEPGTEVKLLIAREGEESFSVTLKRDKIVVKSVKSEQLDSNVAYIKVNQFGDDTTSLLETAFQDAKNNKRSGIVLDLRDNPGGYLETAVDVVGMIIPDSPQSLEQKLKDRVAVLEKARNQGEQQHKTTKKSILGDIPVVVLVNGGSASASEIVAGALKDYGRATIVGEQTFGKGSVQELRALTNGGSVKVTVAKWFTPLGSGIDGKGIEPDVILELPQDTIPSSSDAHVQKALEILAQ